MERLERIFTPKRLFGVMVVGMVLLAVFIVGMLPSSGYFMQKPGRVVPMSEAMTFTPAPKGAITVHEVLVAGRPLRWLERFYWQLMRTETEVAPFSRELQGAVKYGNEIRDEATRSGMYAGVVASGAAPRAHGSGLKVLDVLAQSPAEKAGIKAGSRLVAINSRMIQTDLDFLEEMRAAQNRGDSAVNLYVEGDRSPHRVSLLYAPLGAGDHLGAITLSSDPTFEGMPIEGKLNPDFKGPSAGLATAIATYQALGFGNSAPPFAATGTVLMDGTVAPIGPSARLKAVSVAEANLQYFLVAHADYNFARNAAPGVTVVAVDTFDDVVRWLDSFEGTAAAEGTQP